jgi:hypothetical protein
VAELNAFHFPYIRPGNFIVHRELSSITFNEKMMEVTKAV